MGIEKRYRLLINSVILLIFILLIVIMVNVSTSSAAVTSGYERWAKWGEVSDYIKTEAKPGCLSGDPNDKCDLKVYDVYIFKPGGIVSPLLETSNTECGKYSVKVNGCYSCDDYNKVYSV